MSPENTCDVLIVGGGPAGLSAAIWCARYLHCVTLVDGGDPRNWETTSVNGYLGLPRITPPEMRELGRDECRSLGVQLIDGIVKHISRDGDECFTATLESGEKHVGRRVLLAYGLRDLWPDVPGLEHVYGRNAHVCPDCDGLSARDKKVVVIGTGRRAVGLALNLTTWTDQLLICTNGRPPAMDEPEYEQKLKALNIPVITDRIERIASSRGAIYCMELAGGKSLDADKIFFSLAQRPADDLGDQLGCQRDHEGNIETNAHGLTSVEHVYAAGDILSGPQLAIVAAASGATAALAMHKSLVPDER